MMNNAALPVDSGAFSLAVPPLFAALAPARSILIAGAGGGFDVYAGLVVCSWSTVRTWASIRL
ncbi:hypothetical protein [Micromonospora chersina]|uniref:hypothetical protein n=1 Tax=Micromonospora chersina TaxID=47854 RepID=UPI003D931808